MFLVLFDHLHFVLDEWEEGRISWYWKCYEKNWLVHDGFKNLESVGGTGGERRLKD